MTFPLSRRSLPHSPSICYHQQLTAQRQVYHMRYLGVHIWIPTLHGFHTLNIQIPRALAAYAAKLLPTLRQHQTAPQEHSSYPLASAHQLYTLTWHVTDIMVWGTSRRTEAKDRNASHPRLPAPSNLQLLAALPPPHQHRCPGQAQRNYHSLPMAQSTEQATTLLLLQAPRPETAALLIPWLRLPPNGVQYRKGFQLRNYVSTLLQLLRNCASHLSKLSRTPMCYCPSANNHPCLTTLQPSTCAQSQLPDSQPTVQPRSATQPLAVWMTWTLP